MLSELIALAAVGSPFFSMAHATSLRISMVGDSETVYMYRDQSSGSNPKFSSYGFTCVGVAGAAHDSFGGFSSSNCYSLMAAISGHPSTNVFLVMVGTNDANFGWPASSIVSNIHNLSTALHSRWPGVPVKIVPIPPMHNHASAQSIIDQANSELASQVPSWGDEWWDVWPAGAPNSSDFQSDGIHFKPSGSWKLEARYLRALGSF